MSQRTIVRIKFGSHLYGTATPASDLDFKTVFVPPARDILLQRVRTTITNQRPKAEGEKNVAGELDEEAYSLQRYLGLAAEGQTVALDVLFAPRWSMPDNPLPEWEEIERNRHRLVTRKGDYAGLDRRRCSPYCPLAQTAELRQIGGRYDRPCHRVSWRCVCPYFRTLELSARGVA